MFFGDSKRKFIKALMFYFGSVFHRILRYFLLQFLIENKRMCALLS